VERGERTEEAWLERASAKPDAAVAVALDVTPPQLVGEDEADDVAGVPAGESVGCDPGKGTASRRRARSRLRACALRQDRH
jgi:hypothetical protein